MKLKLRAILTLLISFAAALPLNAATPTPGSSCKKAGLTATAFGKKYTCVKAGSKLVWNKGVVVLATPKPIPFMDPPASPKNLLRLDSRITSNAELSKLEICKTTDMTPDYTDIGTFYKNGFPRPVQSSSGKNSARVLIIPISFNDLPFTTEKAQRGPILSSDLELLNEVRPRVEESFNKLSGGRFQITFDTLPKSQWWEFKSNHPFISTWGVSNFDSIFKLIDS